MIKDEDILALMNAEGPLAFSLKGFEPRPNQQKMMQEVMSAFRENTISLIEAGTGTGKSLAYLIPALIWAARYKEKTVISTHTIALQEQLIDKDIPALLKALNLDLKAVLVKGMHNYICLRKLDEAQFENKLFATAESETIDQIAAHCRQSVEGSRSSLPFVPSSSAWEQVNAEMESCLRQECPHYQSCYFFKARRQAQEAHLLVVNHHLLCADLAKRAESLEFSDPGILPHYKRVIIDEGHHLEDVAVDLFASRLHRLDLLKTFSKLTSDKQNSQNGGKLALLKTQLQHVFKKTPPHDAAQLISRLTIELPALRHELTDQIHHTFDFYVHFMDSIKQTNQTEEGMGKKLRILEEHRSHELWIRELEPLTKKLSALLKKYRAALQALEADIRAIEHDKLSEQTKGVRADIQGLGSRLDTATALLDGFLSENPGEARVRWMEFHKTLSAMNFQLVDANLNISQLLATYLFSKISTIIICSATMTANRQFHFLRERLGLTETLLPERKISESIFESAFNYKEQTLLAIPLDMPPPASPDFIEAACASIKNAIEASKGQAFVLFTSYSMLQDCFSKLSTAFKEQGFPLFKQGDESRNSLLKKFKRTPKAVLFGTDSFWEGVDVVGDALRCVIIVKLPFKAPQDPLVEARTEKILKNGGDPFFDYAVPHAIVKFKQGFGRLIRNRHDRGCIVCLDNRLVTKGYGKLFLASLPDCQRAFLKGSDLWPKMREFYKQTYYMVKQNSAS